MQTFHFLSTSFSHLHPSPKCSEATRSSTERSPSAPDRYLSPCQYSTFFHPHAYGDNGASSNALSNVQPLCEYPTFYSISLFLCIHLQTSILGSSHLLKFCLCLGYSRFLEKIKQTCRLSHRKTYGLLLELYCQRVWQYFYGIWMIFISFYPKKNVKLPFSPRKSKLKKITSWDFLLLVSCWLLV